MANAHPVLTPMDPGTRLTVSENTRDHVDNSQYRSIIGSLMYAATGTRPDLAFTITYLSQFLKSPTHEHTSAAKRVLKHLGKTADWDLVYRYGTTQLTLEGYVDSSWGACPDTRRSFNGYIFQVGGCTISWKARKQRSVATSTTEAEYMAMALGAKQMMWYKQGLKELGLPLDVPKAIRSDSQGGIDLANNPRISDRSGHIDIQYHYTRERLLAGDFSLVYVATRDNLADICTKALTKDTNNRLSTTIMGHWKEEA